MVLLLAKSAESVRSVFGRKVKPLDYRSRSYSKAFCSNSCYEAEISVILDLHDWGDRLLVVHVARGDRGDYSVTVETAVTGMTGVIGGTVVHVARGDRGD